MMEQIEKSAKVTGIDGVYIPVTNRKKAEAWYMEHLGMEQGGDYLLAGRQEVFLRERLDQQVLTFRTNEWLDNGESYMKCRLSVFEHPIFMDYTSISVRWAFALGI